MNLFDAIIGDYKPEEMAEAIINYSSSVDTAEREKIIACRNLYRNNRKVEEFDHITRPHVKKIQDECGNETVETTVLPAKIRHIPLAKTYIRALLSEEGDRPLLLRAFTTDAESANFRDDQVLRSINQVEEARFINKFAALQLRQKALEIQQQILSESTNAQPSEPENEQQRQMALAQVQSQIQQLNQVIESETSVTQDEFNSIKKYFYTDYKTPNEHFAELVCDFTINEQRSRNMLNRSFEDRLVVGREIYHADWLPGMKDPIHRRVIAENICFPDNEHVDYLHQHQWCVEENFMSWDNLVSEFGMYITPEIRRKLEGELKGSSGGTMRQTTQYMPDGTFVGPGNYEKQTNFPTNLSLSVRRVYWKRDEKVSVLIRKKKNRPDYITILNEENTEKMLSDTKKMKSRNERIEYRYIQRLYMAIRVGQGTYLFAGEHPVQLRLDSDKTSVPLPYIGHAQTPYYQSDSLVWETKDLQEMYDLLIYQRELLWMLAGVRGMVYDLSQMPEDMDIEDLVFYRRQGYLFIQSIGKDGKPKQFNQFQNYDDTVSPSIQYVENSLFQIQQVMAFITGMTDQRMGVIKPTDQVGTAELSYNASSLITEKYFQEHEDLTELLFSRLVNLAKVAYEDGIDRGNVVVGPNLMKRVYIPRGGLKGDYMIKMKSGRKESKLMEDYKATAKMMFAKGQMSAPMFVETLATDSFVQLRRLILSYDEMNRKAAQQNFQQEAMQQKEMLEMKAKLDAETKQVLEKAKGERDMAIAQLKAQVESQKIEAQKAKADQESALWNKDIEVGAMTAKYATDKDYEIEMKYLAAQQQEMAIQDRNNKTAMLLDTIQTEMKLGQAKEKVKD